MQMRGQCKICPCELPKKMDCDLSQIEKLSLNNVPGERWNSLLIMFWKNLFLAWGYFGLPNLWKHSNENKIQFETFYFAFNFRPCIPHRKHNLFGNWKQAIFGINYISNYPVLSWYTRFEWGSSFNLSPLWVYNLSRYLSEKLTDASAESKEAVRYDNWQLEIKR